MAIAKTFTGNLTTRLKIPMNTCWLCEKYAAANPLPPYEPDPDEVCILHSLRLDKDKDGRFSAAIKKKMYCFDYDFSGVFFPETIAFENFSGPEKAIFQECIFHNDVSFKGITFDCPVEFKNVEFCGEANFERTKFNHYVRFDEIKFIDGANFSYAQCR